MIALRFDCGVLRALMDHQNNPAAAAALRSAGIDPAGLVKARGNKMALLSSPETQDVLADPFERSSFTGLKLSENGVETVA